MADENEIHEPEEKTAAAPAADVVDSDILTGDSVHERGHASVSATGPTVGEWTPPPYQPGMNEEAEPGTAEKEPDPREFVNPDMTDLPESDKLEGATYMADMAIEVYGEGKKELGNLLLPIKNRRLRRLEEKGLIDQDIMLPRRGGGFAPAGDFIANYNQKATDVFGVRPKFREEVRPILIKEFAKKGIGLTPWQRIGFAVFMDLKEDMKIAMGLRATADEIIEAMKEMTEAVRQHGYGGATQQTTAPPVTEQPPAAAQPAQQAAPVFDPSKPSEAFDHIQNSRPSSATAPPPVTSTAASGMSLNVKRIRKRGPYKKKNKKPHAVTVINVKPNN